MIDKATKRRWKHGLKKMLKVGSEVAEVAVHLASKPTILGGASVAVKAINELWSESEDSVRDFFKGWEHLQITPLGDFVFQLCSAAQMLKEEEVISKRDAMVMTANIHGVTVGWAIYEHWKDGPWASPGTEDSEAKAAIGRFIWESVGSCSRLHQPVIGPTILERDDFTDCYPSKTAEDLFGRLRDFIEAGHTRSVLIFGEPGTGKSHLMRYVVQKAGGLSLRLRSQTFGHISNPSGAIALLRPSAVIVDDLDRIEKPGTILDAFDEVRSSTRLLMVSVNDVSKLDSVTLRPGRFDEVIELKHLDPGVLDRLVSGLPPAVMDQLRVLPIAYIDEFRIRREVLGDAAAIVEIAELHARLETIRALTDKKKKDAPGDPAVPEETA